MKLGEAIERTDTLKPNGYTSEEKTRWLSELDGILVNEVLQWVKQSEWEKPDFPYQYDRDYEKDLLAPPEHADLYIKYLFAQIDFHSGEYTSYNASASLFQAAYDSYAAYQRRAHPPNKPGGFHNY